METSARSPKASHQRCHHSTVSMDTEYVSYKYMGTALPGQWDRKVGEARKHGDAGSTGKNKTRLSPPHSFAFLAGRSPVFRIRVDTLMLTLLTSKKKRVDINKNYPGAFINLCAGWQ